MEGLCKRDKTFGVPKKQNDGGQSQTLDVDDEERGGQVYN